MRSAVRIRPEEPQDWPEIRALVEAAFGSKAEADLVQRLREGGDLVLSLAADDGGPVGHIAFSRLALPETPSARACALAPLAVSPQRQRQGIGSALVREGLMRLAQGGMDLVLVLGEPDYYGRFGFAPDLAKRLMTPYDGPYLQALALSERGKAAHGPAAYARAFAELG
jgi:putative acetyltransferase